MFRLFGVSCADSFSFFLIFVSSRCKFSFSLNMFNALRYISVTRLGCCLAIYIQENGIQNSSPNEMK